MRTIFFTVAATVLLQSTPCTSDEIPCKAEILVRDEAAWDSSFLAFREQFRRTLKNRDLEALKNAIADDIEFSFGNPPSGKSHFLKEWKLETKRQGTQQSPIWFELRFSIEHGGGWVGKKFCFPFWSTFWPEPCNTHISALILNPGTQLWTEKKRTGKRLRDLNTEIVVLPTGFAADWVKISTHDNISGFIAADELVSPIGYRGCFEKRYDKWFLSTFISGD